MNRISGRSAITLLLVAVLILGMAFFAAEYLSNGSEWVTFPGSPHVYNGGNIGCGAVSDRNGIQLLDMNGKWTYSDDLGIRKSTLHWLGDRLGYICAPALSYHSKAMAGYDAFNGVYAYGNAKASARLTLSAKAQKTALEALGDYKGTVGVYNYRTGELICAVSSPTYDPDNIPDFEKDETDAYGGVYVNRFIQSSYIPGSVFKVVTAAAALEEIPDIQEHTFYCDGSYEIGVDRVTCETAHGTLNLQEAFAQSCNCAFAQLTELLGGEKLQAYVDQFQVTENVEFDGITSASGNFDVDSGETVDIAWSGIGQHKDQINPCRYMCFMGAIAAGGQTANPYVVSEIRVGNARTYAAKTQKMDKILSEQTAKTIQDYMRFNVIHNYGDENFPGMTVCAKSGTGEVGADRKPNATFCGFVLDDAYPLAFMVMVEDSGYGAHVCVPIISEVLQTCKAVIDAE